MQPVLTFYLGTHEPSWLARPDVAVPLFVSHRRLRRYKRLPRARPRWALDSGGFTELAMHGRWVTTPEEYLDAVARYADEIGRLDWAAPMDWMCEPEMLAKTGLSVDRHQGLTVENVSLLRAHAPADVRIVPVLQGWHVGEYVACAERYAAAGIDVTTEPVVGVGSVCRRQSTSEIAAICAELARAGISCHGFGVKTAGVARYGRHLASCDSLAWSYNARRNPAVGRVPARFVRQLPAVGDGVARTTATPTDRATTRTMGNARPRPGPRRVPVDPMNPGPDDRRRSVPNGWMPGEQTGADAGTPNASGDIAIGKTATGISRGRLIGNRPLSGGRVPVGSGPATCPRAGETIPVVAGSVA